jgi:signal transduction histidine kinase
MYYNRPFSFPIYREKRSGYPLYTPAKVLRPAFSVRCFLPSQPEESHHIWEGYEKEWHYNGKNRIASYTNVPPGKYLFRVQTLDEANPGLESFRELTVVILPPWWASWWAYVIYMIIAVALLLVAIKLSLFMIKVKNDVYIEQKLSELKIKFFTNISHELRTPLTLIQGPIQELREKEKLSQKGMQYVDLMEMNTKQMLQLVNQILDFRKIQNGKMRLHVSLFNLNEMVDSFEKEFRVMAEENEVSFNILHKSLLSSTISTVGKDESTGCSFSSSLSLPAEAETDSASGTLTVSPPI